MAIDHAGPAELVDLNEWPHGLSSEQSHTLIKTDYVEVARIVLREGREIPKHRIPSPVIIQGLSGTVELTTENARQSIGAGQLLYLEADDPHSLIAIDDSVVLLTIIFA